MFNFANFANFQLFAKIFRQNVLTHDCKNVDGQHPRTKLPIRKNSLQGDTFEVAIALLTVASWRGQQNDGTEHVR